MSIPVPDQLELLRRGLADELPAGGLEDKLQLAAAEGRPLRVKLGVDPTASRVHLGWAVVLRKLRQFQECGHTAVLILGDFTAQVGDPSGKSQTRRRLGRDEVDAYAEQCLGALHQVLLDAPLEVRRNSEWLASMGMPDVLELATHATVAQMLERDDFRKRFGANKPISLIEFLYPLLQAADSVAVEADIELGGTDQTFNNLMGRQLQQQRGQPGQVVCTVPLLVGTDGTDKMSQSLGNYIAVDEVPNEMFGKLMSIPDHLIVDYARLGAWRPTAEVEAMAAGLDSAELHPNATKREVARSIVDLYHGDGSGAAAESAFDRQFRQRAVPEDIPTVALPAAPVTVPELVATTFGVSRGEARRLMSQGGVKLDGTTVSDVDASLDAAGLDGKVLQVGKRRFARFGRTT
ncbi:MAG: tyrosine--tRNA ligase [Acidimicrobiia bacterium]|nr:tyrosine--tRNA ligase [Acidimicrobiia bacterium]